jgi:hypothetical protein
VEERARVYRRRQPEATVLDEEVRDHQLISSVTNSNYQVLPVTNKLLP